MAFSGPSGGGASGPFYKKATLFVGRHGFRTLRRTRAAFFCVLRRRAAGGIMEL